MADKKFVPVMITPFRQNGEIDYDALARLVEFYLAAGAKGLFANCLSSEMFSITAAERLALTRFVVRQVNGRVPVVATGSFGVTNKEKAESIKQIYDTGVKAVILITGHFAAPADRDELFLENIDEVSGLTGSIPLGLYECPAPYKRILDIPIFGKLMQSGRFIYHKDTCLDVAQIKEKLKQIPAGSAMEFYDAHTPNAMYSVRAGAKGMSSISGNFYPEAMVWICNNAPNPDKQAEVQWLQSELNKVDPLIHQAYPLCSKYFLRKRGLRLEENSRVCVQQLTKEQTETLDAVYVSFRGWCEKLNIELVKHD